MTALTASRGQVFRKGFAFGHLPQRCTGSAFGGDHRSVALSHCGQCLHRETYQPLNPLGSRPPASLLDRASHTQRHPQPTYRLDKTRPIKRQALPTINSRTLLAVSESLLDR